MSFEEYDEIERMLRVKGHRFLRSYRGFEDGELRIISTRNGCGEYRWKPIYNEYEEIVALVENP